MERFADDPRLADTVIPPDPAFDKSPYLPQLSRADIQRALSYAEKIVQHDLNPSAMAFVRPGVEACEEWLDNPEGLSRRGRQTILGFLKRTEGKILLLCHPDYRPITRILHAARTFGDALDLESHPEFAGFQDYGDVFEPLSKILRCEVCFGRAEYNKVNLLTNRQYSWYEIVQAVLFRIPDVQLPWKYLPTEYNVKDCKIDAFIGDKIAIDLWRVCHRMSMDPESVVWQLVRFSYYNETLRGPKMSIRTGQWSNLASHVYRMLEWLTPLNEMGMEKHIEIGNATKTMYETVRCVKAQWFDSIDSETSFIPTNAAIELSRRLAGTGEHRSDCSKRSEPMFNFKDFRLRIQRPPPNLHTLSRIVYEDGFEEDFEFTESEDSDLEDGFAAAERPTRVPVPFNGLQPVAHSVIDNLTSSGFEFTLQTIRRSPQSPIL